MTRILNPTKPRKARLLAAMRARARYRVAVMGLVRPTCRTWRVSNVAVSEGITPKRGPRVVEEIARVTSLDEALGYIDREYVDNIGGLPCPIWIEDVHHPARRT